MITKEEEFVLRNWSYYELMTKIKYKAEKAGIELIIDCEFNYELVHPQGEVDNHTH